MTGCDTGMRFAIETAGNFRQGFHRPPIMEENESYAAYAKGAPTVPEDTLDHRFSFFKVIHDLDARPAQGRVYASTPCL